MTLSFLLPFFLPIWADEWIPSSNFSSLSLVFVYPVFFPPVMFSLLNPSHPTTFRLIRHALIWSVLPSHLLSSPPFILNTITFILLLSSLQSPCITSSISPSSIAFCTRHIYHTSTLVFLPRFSPPSENFSQLVSSSIFSFSFLLYHVFTPIKHLTYIVWYETHGAACVCVCVWGKKHEYGVKRWAWKVLVTVKQCERVKGEVGGREQRRCKYWR